MREVPTACLTEVPGAATRAAQCGHWNGPSADASDAENEFLHDGQLTAIPMGHLETAGADP